MRLLTVFLASALPAAVVAGDRGGDPFVPIFAIGATFGSTVAVVAIVTWAAHRRRAMRYELARQALEKGQPLPPELLGEHDRPAGTRDLRRGLTLVALGLGLGLFLRLDEGAGGHWSLGLVPGLLGLGYLATWLLTGRPRGASDDAPAQHG